MEDHGLRIPIGCDELQQGGRSDVDLPDDLRPVSAQQGLQATEAMLMAFPVHLQQSQLRRKRPALLGGFVPGLTHPIEVQPRDQIRRLGIVQTRNPVIEFRCIMHPFGTDPKHRCPCVDQQPAQGITVGTARFHRDLQVCRIERVHHLHHQCLCLLRMRPLHGLDWHPILTHQRAYEVVLGHVHREHNALSSRAFFDRRPVHLVELGGMVSTLTHGDTSNVSFISPACYSSKSELDSEGPLRLFYN